MESCCEMRGPPNNVQVCFSKQASATQQSSMRQFPRPRRHLPSFSRGLLPSFPHSLPTLLCFLSSPQLRPWEGWTLMTDRPGSRYKMEGQLLEACKDLSASGRQMATWVGEGVEADEALWGTLLAWGSERKGRGVVSSLFSRRKMERLGRGPLMYDGFDGHVFLVQFTRNNYLVWDDGILSGYVCVDRFDCFIRFGWVCVQISMAGQWDILETERRWGGGQKLDMTGPHTDVILETHMSESTRI